MHAMLPGEYCMTATNRSATGREPADSERKEWEMAERENKRDPNQQFHHAHLAESVVPVR